MNNSGIQTFDNITVNYTMPGSCPHVLVKDCSTDERFTVLIQNVTLREEPNMIETGLKAIVYVSKRKFELITRLDSDLTTRKLDVKASIERKKAVSAFQITCKLLTFLPWKIHEEISRRSMLPHKVKCRMCISDCIQTTFFHFGRLTINDLQ